MAERQPFSLQAWPTVNKEKERLKYLISRINDQRGSFSNVTEESLEQELRESNGSIINTQEQDHGADVKAVEDSKVRGEEVYKVREEILKQIASVFNDSPNFGCEGADKSKGRPTKKAPQPSTLYLSSSRSILPAPLV